MLNCKQFLLSFKKWKDEFPITEFDISADNELSKITKLQREKNIEALLEIWKEKLSSKYFELSHPYEKKIKSRAIYSKKIGMGNFILMNDESNQHPWIIGQCTNFIDLIITPKTISKASLFDGHGLFIELEKLSEIEDIEFSHKDIEWGFTSGQNTPYHFFYDQYKYLIELNPEKKITDNGSFYLTSKTEKSVNDSNHESFVGLYPTCIGNNHLKTGKSSYLNKKMEDIIYKDAIKNIKTNSKNNPKKHLSLWFGIMGRKRCWTDQVDGLYNIILQLKTYFDEIEVYIDGITAKHNKSTTSIEDNEIFNLINKKTSRLCTVKSIIGKNYKEKINICNNVDLFVANSGSGAIVPLRFCKKPGILHSNSKLFTFPDNYPDTIKIIEKKYVTDIPSKKNRSDLESYIIPWQCVYNYMAELLSEIKGLNIPSISIPQEKIKKEEKKENPFTDIHKRIRPKHESADVLYIVASSFEKTGDYSSAKKVIEQALILRPNGPILKSKLDEYEKILKNT